jgi:cysteine desulfurase
MRVGLDHNATTPLRPEALETWVEVASRLSGNPSSLHAAGRSARAIIDEARQRIAGALAVGEDELVFTSGGTESNNLALLGAVEAAGRGAGLVTSAIEHSSILGPARALAALGRPVQVLPTDAVGDVDLAQLKAAVASVGGGVVSLAAANNEIGSLGPLEAVGRLLDDVPLPRPRFHTDAVQALGKIPVRVREWAEWGVDLASFSAHKVGGPIGLGLLWRRRGLALDPRIHGGSQEAGVRPGTEDAAGIASAAVAIELAVREQAEFARRVGELTRYIMEGIARAVPTVRLVGPPLDRPRLPNTLCILLPGTDGKVLVMRLDLEGLEVSSGSACASGSLEPSHVLRALGHDENEARAALRISLGRSTSRADCDHAIAVFRKLFDPSRAT